MGDTLSQHLEPRTHQTTLISLNMDQIVAHLEPVRQFSEDSVRLVKRCTKPDRKEFQKIAIATAIGFALMGFIGFFCQIDPHPHQQHHSGSLNSEQYSEEDAGEKNIFYEFCIIL